MTVAQAAHETALVLHRYARRQIDGTHRDQQLAEIRRKLEGGHLSDLKKLVVSNVRKWWLN